MAKKLKTRCPWAGEKDYMISYHDEEWGRPVHDDHTHFEMLILEGAQAGLSWDTILRRREGYRKVFSNFDVKKVARYDQKKMDALMLDERIIRNKLKIHATVNNAKKFMEVQKEFGSFDRYVWSFVNGKPIINHWQHIKETPVTTPESDALSKDLKKRGFKFVGSTIIYAHLQAIGVVNDHLVTCFRYCQQFPS